VYNAVSIEERKTPTAFLVNEDFYNDGMSAASSKGMPAIRIIREKVDSECSNSQQIETEIGAVMAEIEAVLTRPLTQEEETPAPKKISRPERIIFNGTLKEINQFFYRRGWTDGLPIVPPTEEEVAEMLRGTDLPADHVVQEMAPMRGKATVEKIAINAVMAGALPTYMPLLISATRAIMDPDAHFSMVGVSTGSWAPFWIVNGPIRNDLHINSGLGALSPGDIANAAIGRAIGLIIKNTCGIRKGVEDMGIQGNPAKYTMVVAENEEESLWEPYHVERGFKKEESTISYNTPNTYVQAWPYGTDDEGILRGMIYNLIPGRRNSLTVTLPPQFAKTLAQSGWTKKTTREFLSKFSVVPAYRTAEYWPGSPVFVGQRGLMYGKITVRESDQVPILTDPDNVVIVVAGGKGPFIGMHIGGGRRTIEKVDLPVNWDKLVNEYKNIVPTYARY
jgi:hypothetical protein